MRESIWNVDSLKALQDERDKRYTERFDSQEKALDIARELAKENKLAANEWRDAMKDREAQFVRKGENAWLVGAVMVLIALAGLFITLSTHWK